MQKRDIKYVITARPAIEGAGVHLHRGFGFQQLPDFDPFLLFDDFSGDNADTYLAGFPWHPHRGIETVTYILEGEVAHQDSIGHAGTIGAGDVQWMSAGGGIIHQEMPQYSANGITGFQLWVNMPQSSKMAAPRYQEYTKSAFPTISYGTNAQVTVIAGALDSTTGPVEEIDIRPSYMDVELGEQSEVELPVPQGHTAFVYVAAGEPTVHGNTNKTTLQFRDVALFQREGESVVLTADKPARVLVATGKPLNEPIAWRGPIVMNTDEELATAFAELNEGTFIQQ